MSLQPMLRSRVSWFDDGSPDEMADSLRLLGTSHVSQPGTFRGDAAVEELSIQNDTMSLVMIFILRGHLPPMPLLRCSTIVAETKWLSVSFSSGRISSRAEIYNPDSLCKQIKSRDDTILTRHTE
jgi:hypothetical protein